MGETEKAITFLESECCNDQLLSVITEKQEWKMVCDKCGKTKFYLKKYEFNPDLHRFVH